MTTENRFGHENHSLGSQERRPEDFITVKSSVRVGNRKKKRTCLQRCTRMLRPCRKITRFELKWKESKQNENAQKEK